MAVTVKKIRPFQHRYGWTPERRREQAARLRQSRLWQHSTGPRTEQGKARSALNSTKHGARSARMAKIHHALRCQKMFMNVLNADVRAQRRYRLSNNNPVLKPMDIRPVAYALHCAFVQGVIEYMEWPVA